MKIQCDVCEKEEASVFCTADEASLCDRCDHRVHHANKLASKHPRFSLLHPSSFQDSPLCDICQERRAFLFCKEDRAILCRECDIPIHKANAHTQKHNRFLLTGVKLSASTSPYYNSSFQTPSYSNGSSAGYTQETRDAKSSDSEKTCHPTSTKRTRLESTSMSTGDDHRASHHDGASVATSSISEYLMETLPGWHVEDFLDPSQSSHPYGFCKAYDQSTPFMTPDPENNFGSFRTEEDLQIWGTPSIDLGPQSRSSITNGLEYGKVKSFSKRSKRKWIKQEEECTVPFEQPFTYQETKT